VEHPFHVTKAHDFKMTTWRAADADELAAIKAILAQPKNQLLRRWKPK
jgi:hypothetical protein